MTLREFLKIRENRFNGSLDSACHAEAQGYIKGWTDAARDIREVLEHFGVDMDMVVIDDLRKIERYYGEV